MSFEYTTRSDGRLCKSYKSKQSGKIKFVYARSVTDLKQKYTNAVYEDEKNIAVDTSVRMKDFTLKWFALNSVNLEESTKQKKMYIINKHIIANLGHKKISDIKQHDIKQLMADMQDIPTTAKTTLQYIKAILNEAIDNDIIHKNVALNIKPPKIVHNEKIPLTQEQDIKLYNSNNKHAPFFILMRYTGMRREEIVALTKNDIDLVNKTISINKAVEYLKGKPQIKGTKNGKNRIVPIMDCVYDIVKKLVKDKQDTDYLFLTEKTNSVLTVTAVRRYVESMSHELGFKFTCHQLRHSYCTMLYYAGIKIKKAQELMGHSSADMVYNIYTHLDETRENADELLNNYFVKNFVNL